MLVLTRFENETVVIDLASLAGLIESDPERLREILHERIEVVTVKIRQDLIRPRMQLGVKCHRELPVHRGEIMEAIDRQTDQGVPYLHEPDRYRPHKISGLPASEAQAKGASHGV